VINSVEFQLPDHTERMFFFELGEIVQPCPGKPAGLANVPIAPVAMLPIGFQGRFAFRRAETATQGEMGRDVIILV
jgi:hypothetical protein